MELDVIKLTMVSNHRQKYSYQTASVIQFFATASSIISLYWETLAAITSNLKEKSALNQSIALLLQITKCDR